MKKNTVSGKPGMRFFIFAVLASVPTFISCSKSQENPVLDLRDKSYSFYEDAASGSVTFSVTLSGASDKNITLSYSTEDSTAIAGKDYVAVSSGTVNIKPGSKSQTITLYFIADTAQKQDVAFNVVFSNPVNCILQGSKVAVKIQNTDYTTLAWSDEFNSSPLNTSNWNYELGAGGWGNNELETYTNSTDNVHIDSGYLHITALNPSTGSYTSGRLTTKGKKEFTHCRVDIRAKLPEGKGIWPALWMLGGNISEVSWPACGEIDIMELLGDNPATVYGTVHWNDNGHVMRGGSTALTTGKFSEGFHIFSVIWAPNHFEWLIDNKSFLIVPKGQVPAFPFDLPQFFIFNVAVGGNWPGSPNETTVFPQHMIVDYIRIYQ